MNTSFGDDDEEDTSIYKVVVNEQGVCSIWPAHRDCALGWKEEGTEGTKTECLDHIEELWNEKQKQPPASDK